MEEPRPLSEETPWAWVAEQAGDAGELRRHEYSRFAFLSAATLEPGARGGHLFVDGSAYPVKGDTAAALAAELADCRVISWARLIELGAPTGVPQSADEAEIVELLLTLVRGGLLYVPSDEPEDEGEEEEEEPEMIDLSAG